MLTNVVQRWRDRRGTYRPAGETIDTSRYEVASISDDRTAKTFVQAHHYSGTYPAARFRFGLHCGADLVGVAVFSQPVNNLSLACFPGEPAESCELGRFVLVDDVPANGESWFLARAFDLLRSEEMSGIISMSDPFPRTDAAGCRVFGGHIGNIYQATNAVYRGRARPDTLRLLPDGSVLHSRALAKIRKRDRGWRYSAALLEAHGAEPLGDHDDARAWLDIWVDRLCRTVKHPGNHRYAFPLTRACRKHLPPSLPYPKFSEAA